MNKKSTDLSVPEKLCPTDRYDELNLNSFFQKEAAAKLGVPDSLLSKLLSRETIIMELMEQ